MAKGPFITDRIRQLIASEHIKDPKAPAKEIQYTVNKQLNGKGPGLSSVQKELARIRKNDNERPSELKRLDELWSIGTLAEYDITPEALPKLVQIQNLRRHADKPLTIREAKWVSRLHAITTEVKELSVLSIFYALQERISEISNIPNDTSNLDDVVLLNPIGATALLFFEFMPDPQEKALEETVYKIEDMFGLNLDRPGFKGSALVMYGSLITSLLEGNDLTKISKGELKHTLLEMRNTAKTAAKDLEIPAGEVKNKFIKEHYYEGSHNKEG